MEILSNYQKGCSLALLAERAQLNKNTVHRLLQRLQSYNYAPPDSIA